MIHSKHCNLFFLCLLFATFLKAQSVDPFKKNTISSPNAASLGKYADVPVSNHTGIPQVSIPLYTIKEGPLQLPISISYHAGGIKLSELASSVGLGWSLNAGGVITRTVQGTPDEKFTAYNPTNEKGHLSDGGYNQYIMMDDIPTGPSPLTPKQEAINYNIRNGIYDGEPDLFFFNFSGYSGKFYFHDDGRPVIVPEQDLKITYDYTPGGGNSISSFIITTPDGTKYFFGKTVATNDVDPIEKTILQTESSYANSSGVISSWYMNKVVSVDELFSINLTYATDEYKYFTLSSYPLESSAVSGTFEYNILMNWVQGVRLSVITFSNGTVNFDEGPARQDLISKDQASGNFLNEIANTFSKALGAIRILDPLNNCNKKFNFTYNYFEDNLSSLPLKYSNTTFFTDRKRLRLDKIQEEDCLGVTKIPPHIFEYFTESVTRRLSLAQDHWGFMNGKTSNSKLIPTYIEQNVNGILTEYSGGDRDSYWPAMRGGALRKITYPTGGFSEFEFEANTSWLSYTKYVKTNIGSLSCGYSGGGSQSNTYNSIVVQSHGHPFTFRLSNPNYGNNCGSTGNAYSNGGAEASIGQTVETTTNPPVGNYTVSISKPGAVSGCGAEVFIYEWVPTQIQENKIIGGLRIKTLKHNNGDVADLITNYNYNIANGQSSGHLYSRPVYVQIVRNDFLKEAGNSRSCNIAISVDFNYPNGCTPMGSVGTNFEYRKSPNSIRPMETSQGNHIGYNEVKISQVNNGYSIYRYYGSNVWDILTSDVATRFINIAGPICALNIPNYPAAPPDIDLKRGELKYESHFNEANVLLKEVWYYPVYTENPVTTLALRTESVPTMAGLPTFYQLKTGRKTEMKIEETLFSGSTYLTNKTEIYYESNYHNQVTRKLVYTSSGDVLETKFKYAPDFRLSSCDAISNGFQTYLNAVTACNNAFYQTETFCTNCTAQHNAEYCRYWKNIKKLQCLSQARIAYITASKNYYNPSNPSGFILCRSNLKNTADVNLKPILELQDKFQIVPVEATSWKNSKLTSASFTKYDFVSGTSNVYPKIFRTINLTAPSSTFTTAAVSAGQNSLVLDTRYTDEGEGKFVNGQLAEVKGKDGVYTSYLYGYNNTLPIAKVTGATYATVSTAYTALSNNLSQLRTHSSLINALVTTYTYSPLIGITSETDPNGRTIYYEYDAFNRLSIVRDKDNNIIKKICYNYAGQIDNCTTDASWQLTGNTRCKPCTINTAYPTNILQNEQKDLNPNSLTYNQTQWIDVGANSSCITSVWQNQGSPYCELNGGDNTGNQLQLQKDMNPCSPTYNQTQVILLGYNPSACPLPGCSGNNCYAEGYKCVYGNCELGYKVYTSSYYDWFSGMVVCTYHYEWSDYTWSGDYQEYSIGFCYIQ